VTKQRRNTYCQKPGSQERSGDSDKDMEDLQETDQKDDHNTTKKIINSISGQGSRPNPKVKKCDPLVTRSFSLIGESTLLSYLIMTMVHLHPLFLHQLSKIYPCIHQPLMKYKMQLMA
tara:strand:+ start:295 stop:648 length:354 start_codon:yes stop_codon:yes gene_type:complete